MCMLILPATVFLPSRLVSSLNYWRLRFCSLRFRRIDEITLFLSHMLNLFIGTSVYTTLFFEIFSYNTPSFYKVIKINTNTGINILLTLNYHDMYPSEMDLFVLGWGKIAQYTLIFQDFLLCIIDSFSLKLYSQLSKRSVSN